MRKKHFILVLLGIGILTKNLYSQNPDNQEEPWKTYEMAQKYEKEGNLEKALELYQKVLESSAELSFKKTVLITIAQIYKKGENMMMLLKFMKR